MTRAEVLVTGVRDPTELLPLLSRASFLCGWKLGLHTRDAPADVAQEAVVVTGKDGKLLHQLLLSLEEIVDT